MSDATPEEWEAKSAGDGVSWLVGGPDRASLVVLSTAETDGQFLRRTDECERTARRIVADHNACLTMADPETAVAGLVGALNKLGKWIGENVDLEQDYELQGVLKTILPKGKGCFLKDLGTILAAAAGK